MIFYPRDNILDWIIMKIDDRFSQIKIDVHSSHMSGIRHFYFQQVNIHHQQQVYFLPEVQLSIGLKPLIKSTVNTGPELELDFKRGKQLAINGQMDLARLLDLNQKGGLLHIDADFTFEKWNEPPVHGQLSLKSDAPISIVNDLEVQGAVLDASLDRGRLDISRLKFNRPVALSSTGHLDVNWNNVPSSFYQVQGTYQTNGSKTEFQQNGRLDQWLP